MRNPADLELTDISIPGEYPLSGDRVLLEVSPNLQNHDTGLYSQVTVNADGLTEVPIAHEPLLAFIRKDDGLAVGESKSWPGGLACIVGNADVTAAIAELENLTALSLTVETIAGVVLNDPVDVLSEASVISQTTLVSGEILLECDVTITNNTEDALHWLVLEINDEDASVGIKSPPPHIFYQRIEANDRNTIRIIGTTMGRNDFRDDGAAMSRVRNSSSLRSGAASI